MGWRHMCIATLVVIHGIMGPWDLEVGLHEIPRTYSGYIGLVVPATIMHVLWVLLPVTV